MTDNLPSYKQEPWETSLDEAVEMIRDGRTYHAVPILESIMLDYGVDTSCLLGRLYSGGIDGIPPIEIDYKKAAMWYKKGINCYKNRECYLNLGKLYCAEGMENKSVEKILEGLKLIKHVEDDDPVNTMYIVFIYFNSELVETKLDEVLPYLLKAEKLGFCFAKYYLAKEYFRQKKYFKYIIKRVESIIYNTLVIIKYIIKSEEFTNRIDLRL